MKQTIQLKHIISDSIQFFVQNWFQIARLCLPFMLAGSIFNNIVLGGNASSENSVSMFMISTMVNLALNPIYTAALILMMAGRAARQQPPNSELVSAALGRYAPLLLLTLVKMGLMWVGFLALVLPGIWIAVRLSFADFFLVIDGMDPRQAMIRSFHATRLYFFPILVSLAIFALPLFGVGLLLNNLLSTAKAGTIMIVLADVALGYLALFLHVILFRIFMEAKSNEPAAAQ